MQFCTPDMINISVGCRRYKYIGDGADTSDAENWAVGRDMPEAGFEILKATVTAKTPVNSVSKSLVKLKKI